MKIIFFLVKIIFKPQQLTQLHEGQLAYLKRRDCSYHLNVNPV